MISILQFGSFLLAHAWIVPLVIVVLLAIGFFMYGPALLGILRAILNFCRSPVGQVAIILLVLYFAASAGYQLADGECNAAQLRTELANEKVARLALEDQVKSGNEIAATDALRARQFGEDNEKLKRLIDATPKNDAACLSVDDVRRLRRIK